MVTHELEEASRRADRLEPLQVRGGNAHLELVETSDHGRKREREKEPVPLALLGLGWKTRNGRLAQMLELKSDSLGVGQHPTVKWDGAWC